MSSEKNAQFKMKQLPKRDKTRYKKGKVLPSDNNSPNRTDHSRERTRREKKERFCSPNKTDYPRETEPGEKKERFCLQITTAQIRPTTQVRQTR